MFPLRRQSLPADSDSLREALEESLRQVLIPAGQMVAIEEKAYPKLAAIRISLDRAQAGNRPPPRPAPPVGAVEPALQIGRFEISGRPLLVRGAAVDLSCTARQVRLGQSRDKGGNVLLLLQDAAEGSIEISIAVADLEAIVLAAAKVEAGKQGVTVEDLRIELQARSERALDVVVQVNAKKLFLSASVRISGRLEIDQELRAGLSGLDCTGEGTLGTLACGFLSPQLQRFNGREFSLMALPLGEVKLRDVRIAADRELQVTAAFGSSLA